MKANEAPEKIYFSSTEDGTHYYTEGIPFEREYIEYVRKDAFIEKAIKYIANHFLAPGMDSEINDFVNYMKAN